MHSSQYIPSYNCQNCPQISCPQFWRQDWGRGRGGRGPPPVGLSAVEDYPGAAAHHPTSVHYLRGQQTNTNVKSIPQENILQMFPMTRNLKVRPMDSIQNGNGHMNILSTDLLVQYTLMFPQSTNRLKSKVKLLMIKNASYVFPSVLNLFGMFKALCVKHWRFSKHLKSQNKTLKLHLDSKHNFC